MNVELLNQEFDLMLKPMPAVVGNIAKIAVKTFTQLSKMNTEVLHDLYAKIFGYNFEASRLELLTMVNRFMQKVSVAQHQNEDVDAGFAALDFNARAAFAQNTVEVVRPVEDDMVYLVLELLDQGFTCAQIGRMEMGVSAKQVSRIKRGRRYSAVTGREEQKPVARKGKSADTTLEAFGL